MRILRRIVEWLDETLDKVPSYEDSRWYRYGDWGCRIGLGRLWTDPAALREWREQHTERR